jgi:hypothetical protein
MAETSESLMIRMGWDAREVQLGAAKMIADQAAVAQKTLGIWKQQSAEKVMMSEKESLRIAEISRLADVEQASRNNRAAALWRQREESRVAATAAAEAEIAEVTAAAEKAMLAASWKRYQENMAAKAAASKAWLEEQSSQSAIGSGSGGVGSGFQTAEQKAAAGAEGGLTRNLEAGAVGALAGEAAHMGSSAGIFRETAVIIREGFRKNWSRMVGSLSLLAQYAGLTATTIISSIPIIGTGIAAAVGMVKAAKGMDDNRGDVRLNKNVRSDLEKQIANLVAAGKLSPEAADAMGQALNNGVTGIRSVQRDLAPLLPNGFEKFETIDEKIKKVDELAAREQKELDGMLAKKRAEKTLEQDIADKTAAIAFLKQNIAALDSNSLDSHEARERLVRAELDLQKDLTQQAEQQKQLAEKTAAWKKWSADAARVWMREQIAGGMEEGVYPTLENLAGRLWTERLNKRYGQGGFYDLGRGNGAFAANAQDYLLAQKQQEYDRTYGNMGAAENDRQRMIAERDYLVSTGVANPTMLLSKIEENTDKVHALWRSLVANGVIQVGVNDPEGRQ